MKRIKVSVLIYVLNSVSYIEKCVRSVMAQTLQEIEILVIDGGSTDGTLEIIKKLAHVDARIRIIHCVSGVGLQFNTGLREAQGEYIGICESDDYLLPGMYEEQYRTAKEYQLDILRADAVHFSELEGKGELFFPSVLSKQKELYDKVLDLTWNACVLKLGINSFWSGLYRREFLLEQKIFMNETKGASYQDISFTFLSAIKAKRVMLSDRAFYCYRLDNPNSSVNYPRRMTMVIDEYRLLKERMIGEQLFEKYKGIFLSWKVKSHVGFYDSLPEEQRKAYIEVMYRDIRHELADRSYSEEELTVREKEVVNMVGQSAEALGEYFGQIYSALNHVKQSLECINKDKEVVIFGCGAMGRLVRLYMTYTGRRIAAFIDNKQELWGSLVEQIPVMEPEKSVLLYPDAVYIIANIDHSEDMKKQLLRHICEEQMIVCNDYGFFLKHILLKTLKENEGLER